MSEKSLDRTAWLAPVEIVEPSLKEKGRVETELTLSLERYLEQARLFRRVAMLPGRLSEGDLVLRVRFDRYRQSRRPHPAYFPGALLTATLYIWFGGPIFVDTTDLHAELQIEDGMGTPLSPVETEQVGTRTPGLWSPEYVLPSGIGTRTELVGELLPWALKN